MKRPTTRLLPSRELEQLAEWSAAHPPTEPEMLTVERALVERLGKELGQALRVWRRHIVLGKSLSFSVCRVDVSDLPFELEWEGAVDLAVRPTGARVHAELLAFCDGLRVGPVEHQGQATYGLTLDERDGQYGWQKGGWSFDSHREWFGVTHPQARGLASSVVTTYG